MAEGYDSHADYMGWAKDAADAREVDLARALRAAFRNVIASQPIDVISFRDMSDDDLARALLAEPLVLKAVCAACNVAGRAIDRDLGIRNLDTYNPRLDSTNALALARYLKEFLPDELALPALVELDRHFFVDKTVRGTKGRWEKSILASLTAVTSLEFKKRMFKVDDEEFVLDGAYPPTGAILVGIDVKRIEARRDIHKRSDEVVNKAAKFKRAFPEAKFGAVVYYPFADEHDSVRRRMNSPNVDAVAFASQDEAIIREAVGRLSVDLDLIGHAGEAGLF